MLNLKEAQFYEAREDKVHCKLCPQNCLIHPGSVGLCSVRFNKDAKLYAISYGRISSKNLDPIEKKPLYRFFPGKQIFSVGSLGCNLGCPFCQNWEIAQLKDYNLGDKPWELINTATTPMSVQEVIDEALRLKQSDNIGIAYTYNEPLMSYEFVRDCSVKASESGLKNVLVTNGYIQEKPLEEILPYIDAMNIDLKGFSDEIYKMLGARLKPVLRTIKQSYKAGVHIEITNLIVPGLNDDLKVFEQMIHWLSEELGNEVPLHISRYFPSHKYLAGPTSLELMQKAAEIAARNLKYVFLGNV